MQNHSNEIGQILEKKRDAYAEFLSATLLLKKALDAEEMATVSGLIERRSTLMGVIDGLDREMVRYQKTGHYEPIGETGPRTAALSANLSEKLRKIFSENQDCHAIAADRLSRLRKELLTLHERAGGVHGYNHPVGQVPKFLNVRT